MRNKKIQRRSRIEGTTGLSNTHRYRLMKAGQTMCLSEKYTSLFNDPFLRRLEERYIISYLKPSMNLLHLGCSGITELHTYAPLVQTITALESDGALIAAARKEAEEKELGNITFMEGSIDTISSHTEKEDYDCIISPQCLTSLPGWDLQEKTLNRLHRLLKQDGLLIISECFHDELEYLNKLRGKLGLSHFQGNTSTEHTLYPMYHGEFDIWALRNFTIESLRDFGVYFFLTCIVQPLSNSFQKSPPDTALNEVALTLSAVTQKPVFREISAVLCYILKKK